MKKQPFFIHWNSQIQKFGNTFDKDGGLKKLSTTVEVQNSKTLRKAILITVTNVYTQ